VTDAVEALGEDVDQETADELMGVERHRLPAIGGSEPIILPAERHATVIGGDQSLIGDGDAMRVARQIAQYWFRPGERLFGVNDPFEFSERRQEGDERIPDGEICVTAEEPQLVGVMRLD